MSNRDEVLCARGIAKHYVAPRAVTVLRDISLSLARGEAIAIVGRSGEGKSTLLHILGTLETPDRGTLSIAGKHVTSRNPSRIRTHHIGFIYQGFHLLDHYTALDNVLMPARIARRASGRRSEAHQRAEQLLEQVGLTDRALHDGRLLSGGEKQRVAIARALMNDPDVILADEPTGNLDHVTSNQLQEMLLGLTKDIGKGLIVVTHDRELADRCDRSYLLSDGTLTDVPKKKVTKRK